MISLIEFITEAKQKEAERKKTGISIINQILSKDEVTQNEIKNQIESLSNIDGAFKLNGPCIYCFTNPDIKDAIKIGYTDQHPEKRIAQWKEIYGDDNVKCLGYWSSEVIDSTGEKVFFWDHAVHEIVISKGHDRLNKDKVTGTFFLDDLTDSGKEKVINLPIYYSREFFKQISKYDTEKLAKLNEVVLEKILEEMKQQIINKKANFRVYHFTKEGKQEGKMPDVAWGSPQQYNNTDLQKDAIDEANKLIKAGKTHLLMAAVMRFGKTHTAYEIINDQKLKRVVVVSAKADVREAWKDDINHKDFYKNFVFIEINNQYNWAISAYDENEQSIVTRTPNIGDPLKVEELYKDKTIIYFFTLQDLAGNLTKTKTKHEHIFSKKFDMMVVDETHYGSHASSFGKITGFAPQEIQNNDEEEIDPDDEKEAQAEQREANKLAQNISSKGLKYKISLQVSGTPYYILASNEMLDPNAGIITKVSFTDMLKARDDWNRKNNKKDPDAKKDEDKRQEDWESPYFGIPNLRKIGLSLSDECRDILKDSGYTASMTVLFETKDDGKFKHEHAIKDMMRAIFGDGKSDKLAFMKNKQIEGKKICKHTMIVLPRIKACTAMEKLLNDLLKGGDREILNLTNGTIGNVHILNKKLDDIEKRNKKSIILTVNRMLTGTSMPKLDSMIYMKNAKSPQEYDQNIFRLCTRNVKKVIDEKTGDKRMVNLKDNVYLIDFNIDNTLQMMANSAKMKAMADIHDGSKEPITDLIEKYMKEDAEAMPLWSEGKDDILGKMEKIDPDNLMKVYTKYNENKSINDIVNSEVDVFKQLFWDAKFQDAIRDIDVPDDNGKNIIVPPSKQNVQEITINKTGHISDRVKNELNNNKKKKEIDREAQKIAEAARRKFIALSKKLLYLNICLDEPYNDFDKLLSDVGHNKVLDNLIDDFDINIEDAEKVYKTMKTAFKAGFNQIFTRINLFFTKGDNKLKDIDKFNKSVEGLGKVAKNEVMTPDEIVDKMIAKLDDSEYKNAESILLVNEKKGEFLQGLIRKFGKNIAKKCKVIPSSMIGKQLTGKMLKTQGLNNYINTIIVNLEDYDKSGKIDVNDFLKMNNEQILKENNGKKFDIVLMNPPYSDKEQFLDMNFVRKTNLVSNKNIVIHPAKKWCSNTKIGKENAESKHLKSLEIIDANKAFNLSTSWKYAGIFEYDNINEYTEVKVIHDDDVIKINYNDYEERKNYYKTIDYSDELKEIVSKKEKLYKELIDKYKTMVNDGHGFVYEEKDLKRGEKKFNIVKDDEYGLTWKRHMLYKSWLKDGKYKYCLYKGSFNHDYDEVQEWKGQDPYELFNGQILWLTNKENVKNNIKYWLECSLCDLWRKYKFLLLSRSNIASGCAYGQIPALDFEMNEDKFKKYVDSLNDFTKEEIQILKDNNVHNANKL